MSMKSNKQQDEKRLCLQSGQLKPSNNITVTLILTAGPIAPGFIKALAMAAGFQFGVIRA